MTKWEKLRSASAAMLVGMAAGMHPAIAGEPQSSFTGHWRVARVAVSDLGVQALVDDDPSLMGKRLTFTSARLAWDQTPSTGDVRAGPDFQPLERLPSDAQPELRKLGMHRPVAYVVHCQTGTWGPGRDPVIYRGAAGALALPWYDGAVMMLVREPG
ncbi:hypothetical protein MKK75_35335 [Methylobacterium sp. J-030]|uniref:hypothetical protein n=1 Tax=Methylobacterium sp. J-030 TaxID=2836627 RepID=UPI001FBBBDB8|nr:hypothetical protein [Methylobacterium sp. J-030]MCJ2074005.1 hypothetical protein [Methylobacterium sp. J-030]